MVKELPPYEERVPKDSYDMPMRYYHINSSNPNDLKMFAHWHNEIEIQLFEKGHAVSTIDNTEVEAEENDIVFIPSQSIHFGCADLPVLNVHTFIFHAETLCSQNYDSSVQKYFKPFINRTAHIPYVISPADKGYAQLRGCLDEIITLAHEKPVGYELLARIQLTKFFVHLYQNGYVKPKKVSTVADKNYQAVRDAITYIERNYSLPLTVDKIAANAGFSKSRFMSIFKEFTNTSCKKYINKCRMESAQNLLVSTNETVLEIAISCGYNNISLFNREFKKTYGATPMEYRKIKRAQA